MAPFNTSAALADSQRVIHDLQRACDFVDGENERRVDPHSWRVPHEDQAATHTLLEELNAARLAGKIESVRRPVCPARKADEIEADQQSASAYIRHGRMTSRERPESVAQLLSHTRRVLDQSGIPD